jgi:hypothetical protein
MALQNCSYKESQDKEPIYGAGFVKAHAMGRGKRKFELDFEVKELNQSVIEEPTNAPRSKTTQLKVVKIGGAEYASLLDIKNATVLIVYPAKTVFRRSRNSPASSSPTWRKASPSTIRRWARSAAASPSGAKAWCERQP